MVEALMIVAHPDDETIWAGGLIERKKNWHWTIASMCRASDPDRKPKFEKVCREYGAKSFIADLEDETLEEIDISTAEKLLSPLEQKKFDFIFTHGENGEYGHIRHKDTHRAVVSAVRKKKLDCRKLFVFAYEKNGIGIVPGKEATKKIGLDEKELERKKNIVEKEYGYARDSPDVQYCTKTEAFKEVIVK